MAINLREDIGAGGANVGACLRTHQREDHLADCFFCRIAVSALKIFFGSRDADLRRGEGRAAVDIDHSGEGSNQAFTGASITVPLSPHLSFDRLRQPRNNFRQICDVVWPAGPIPTKREIETPLHLAR